LQPKIKKNIETPYFRSLRSFKVIDVGIPDKLVSNACYDRPTQQIVPIGNLFHTRRVDTGKINKMTTSFDEKLLTSCKKFGQKQTSVFVQHTVKIS